MDIQSKILSEKRQYEYQFANSLLVFENASSVLDKFGWLTSSMITNERVAKMWELIQQGATPVNAAVEADIFYELSQNNSGSSPLNIDEYARQIDESAYLLRSIDRLLSAMKHISKGDKEAMRVAIDEIANDRPTRNVNVSTTQDMHSSFVEMVGMVMSNSTIKTGYKEIDSVFGFIPRETTILAARPGVGKTTISLNFAINIAKHSFKVLFLSLEMSKEELWAKLACGEVGVSWNDLRLGNVSHEQVNTVLLAGEELMNRYSKTMFVRDDIWDIPEIISTVMAVRPDFVVIDHLGEIVRQDNDKAENEVKFLGNTARTLRRIISRTLGIPLLLVHQLSRSVEARQDKRAVLSDLRGSGELEQIADNVIILFREDYADGSRGQTFVPIEVHFRKMRGGQMNYCAVLGYDLIRQRFSDLNTNFTELNRANPVEKNEVPEHYVR